MKISIEYLNCFTKAKVMFSEDTSNVRFVENRRTKNFQGCLNSAVEYLVSSRFEYNLQDKKLNFVQVNLKISLSMFLRSGFFDELIDGRVVVEEFKLRYSEVLRNYESYFEIHKKLLSFENCKYLNLKMKARTGLISDFREKNEPVANKVTEKQFPRKDITNLTLGVTVSDEKLFQQFLSSLSTSINPRDSLEIIVCCHKIETKLVTKLINKFGIFSSSKVIPERWGHFMGENGELEDIYKKEENRTGVSWGRTVLHRALFEYSNFEKIWILDEDMVFSEKSLSELDRSLDMMQRENKIVGVGRILGDAPLPAAYTISSQICDFFYSSFTEEKKSVEPLFSELFFHDMHHDLATSRTYHVEFPVGIHNTLNKDYDKRILSGKSITRRVHSNFSEENIIISRGGNTLLTSRKPLIEYSNSTPRICNVSLRRGDTHWVTRAKKHLKEAVTNIDLSLIQVRNDDFSFTTPNGVRGDIMGSILSRILQSNSEEKLDFRTECMVRESRLICNLVRSCEMMKIMSLPEEQIQIVSDLQNHLIVSEWCDSMNEDLDKFLNENV